MVAWGASRRQSPVGLDIGSRSIKLLQLTPDGKRLMGAARMELPLSDTLDPKARSATISQTIRRAREGQDFRGRDAVVCLGSRELFVQNIRVPKTSGEELEIVVRQEAASRLPYPIAECEWHFLEAADVRQGDSARREVIVLACHRPVLDDLLATVESAGLRPVAVDVEPLALLRCYSAQFRRDEDKEQRAIFVHVGALNTAVVIAQGTDVVFIKYVGVGGCNLDETVAKSLDMSLADAIALRRHNSDRRTDQQDPDVAKSIAESIRPVIDRLVNEISLCIRYYSVTFRGQPLMRLVLGGGEASPSLVDLLAPRLNLSCELADPLRSCEATGLTGRRSQWDVVTGLAMRVLE